MCDSYAQMKALLIHNVTIFKRVTHTGRWKYDLNGLGYLNVAYSENFCYTIANPGVAIIC